MGSEKKVLVITKNCKTRWVIPSMKEASKLLAVSQKIIKEHIEDGDPLLINGKIYYVDYSLD